MDKLFTVYDRRTGEVHARGLSFNEAGARLATLAVDDDAMRELRKDDPDSELFVLKLKNPFLIATADDEFDELRQKAAVVGWDAARQGRNVINIARHGAETPLEGGEPPSVLIA